jgi:prepilin-type N-terminal cleavage/methylation domain-containing protein
MLNFFYRALNNKKGFTLIEVLVVVAIIGILAALAAPMVMRRIEDARQSSDRATMKILNDAVVTIVLDNAVNPREVPAGISEPPSKWNSGLIKWGELKTYLDNGSDVVFTAQEGFTFDDETLLRDFKDKKLNGDSKRTITIIEVEGEDDELIHKFIFEDEVSEEEEEEGEEEGEG